MGRGRYVYISKLKMAKAVKQKKRLALLDAHAILHRAYHALPDFRGPKGEPTGGLYGLSSMLIKIINELRPDYIASCYDLPEPTYRHEVYEGYKAGRAKADDALVEQIIRSREVFSAFGIPVYEHSGFEADDMLGTIVEQMKKDAGTEVVIASGDMDTLQLVEKDRVRVYTLRKGLSDTVTYDEKAVKERFGFPPKLLPDFKGLRGDPSDNIIGIPGIGEKTATELITVFGGIESIYKTLHKDETVFIDRGIKPRIVALLKEHEEEAHFSKMLAEIRRDAPISFSLPDAAWNEGERMPAVSELFSRLGFRSLIPRAKSLFGDAEDVPPAKEESTARERPDEREVRAVSIALWLVHSDMTNPSFEDICRHAKTESFGEARAKILEALEKENLNRVYEDIELPLIPIIEKMEARGFRIDKKRLEALSKEYHAELSKIEKRIFKHAGGAFNVNSPRQLGEVLFDKLGLSVKNQKRTGTGQRSTRESELEKMRGMHPVIDDVLQYRELQKLLSTYIDNIPNMLDGNSRLHTRLLQSGTTTGRMSSQDPNLQNIPIKTELGRNIRDAFVAEDGYVLAAFDYSQIELRIAAFLSGDEKLIRLFKEGGDIHRGVAAEVFDVPPEYVDSEMRRQAKVINFGILYGMGVNALRQNLGTDRTEAEKFYREYFKNFAGLAEYIEHIKHEARRNGYTTTLFGRKRRLEGMRSPLPYIRAQAERMAVNAPMQGTQADIIKTAMVCADEYIRENKLENDVFLLLQVHDELVYEIKKEHVETVAPEIKKIMEGVLSVKETKGVPILADVSVGEDWGNMKKILEIESYISNLKSKTNF